MKSLTLYLLCCNLVIISPCGFSNGNNGRIEINMNRALKHKHSMNELCTDIKVINLDLAVQPDFGISSKPIIAVSDRKVFILDSTSTRIGFFEADGTLCKVIDIKERVLDYCVYEGKLIDVLTANGVIEFSAITGDKINSWQHTGIANNYEAIGRRGDKYIHLIGTLNNRLVDKSISLPYNKSYSGCINPISTSNDAIGGRFFECRDSLFFTYRHSGTVVLYTGDDFIYPVIEWDFSKDRCNRPPSFTNAQKKDMTFYFCICYEGADYLLIFDSSSTRYKVIDKTSEGMRVPLGVISDGVNYVVCDIDTASIVLNSDITGINGPMVLLEYSLSAE